MANISEPSLSQGISSTTSTVPTYAIPSITQGENSIQPYVGSSEQFTPPLNLPSDNSRLGLSIGASPSYYAPI